MTIKFLTKAILEALPPLYANEDKEADETPVIVKLFNPMGKGTWYITEYNPEDGTAFGFAELGDPDCAELGYVNLYELVNFRRRVEVEIGFPLNEVYTGTPDCLLGIERDIHLQPGKLMLSEVMDKVKRGVHV